MAEPPEATAALDSRTLMQWAVVLAVALALLWVGRPFLIPLAVAVLLWTLLNGLAAIVRRVPIAGHRLPGWLALALATAVIALAVFLVYRVLASQIAAFVEVAPQYEESLRRLIEQGADLLGLDVSREMAQLRERIDVPGLVSGLAAAIGTLAVDIVWVGIYLAFLLLEQRRFSDKVRQLRPPGMNAGDLERLLVDMARKIQFYLWIKTLMGALTALVGYGILWALDVDFAPLWALIIFFLNYIPNIGSFVAVLLPVALSLVQFEALVQPLLLLAALGLVQFLIGNVLEPQVAGRSLNLSPLVIILALTFWGMLWGVAGMVLCVPITVSLAIVCSYFSALRWIAVLLSSDGRVEVTESGEEGPG